ncbi:FadR/GntR family transcriptional regulator [Aidingimonas halophila]|uniref:DNA-binding transcriptional regulator, FadR family n=1 Tax=Aidingimonas halophila TaxID=574349 RepID=A0A1H2RRF4_9GAMM|nr:FCD domain-containing protein [Aidingimonas halophila]GHC18813.1 GntR family transcriptional regulator [Aidingimonas halophila]SDW22046.1 DNA-binding transcriptional regulator, FadR family [Aidingimonas halophila]
MSASTPRHQRRKRTAVIGEAIKEYIASHGLGPGDRLPQESHLIDVLDASKGTIREALRGLESQGLIHTRTGPGGGAFITEVTDDRAMELLGNYFFFRPPTIHDIYQVRKQLEPTLVASLDGQLNDDDVQQLESVMSFYDHPPESLEEERQQRIKELEFHLLLVDHCPNPLLALMCRFPIRLLMSLTTCQRIYGQPYPELRRQGHDYQRRLIDALRQGQVDTARDIMAEHMQTAQGLMEEREAMLDKAFFRAETNDDGPSHEYLALSDLFSRSDERD